MSDYSGLGSLVSEIRDVSDAIAKGDAKTVKRLDQLEAGLNELFKKAGRPGAEWHSVDDAERKDAIALREARHYEKSPKNDGITVKQYVPTSAEIDEATVVRRSPAGGATPHRAGPLSDDLGYGSAGSKRRIDVSNFLRRAANASADGERTQQALAAAKARAFAWQSEQAKINRAKAGARCQAWAETGMVGDSHRRGRRDS